jgi:hypothetical protein
MFIVITLVLLLLMFCEGRSKGLTVTLSLLLALSVSYISTPNSVVVVSLTSHVGPTWTSLRICGVTVQDGYCSSAVTLIPLRNESQSLLAK